MLIMALLIAVLGLVMGIMIPKVLIKIDSSSNGNVLVNTVGVAVVVVWMILIGTFSVMSARSQFALLDTYKEFGEVVGSEMVIAFVFTGVALGNVVSMVNVIEEVLSVIKKTSSGLRKLGM
jgi:hypothetical protein